MIERLFSMDQPIWAFMTKVGWALLFNIIFFVTSIPVITIGASLTAMNAVMMKVARNEGNHYIRLYFHTWIHSFLSSTASWLLTLIVAMFLAVDLILLWHESMMILFGVVIFACVGSLMFIQTVFALTARFEGSWWETIGRARFVWMQDFGFVLLAAVLNAGIFAFISWSVAVLNIFSWMVILWFGLPALINGFIYNRIFDKYVDEDDEEETGPEQLPEDPFAQLRGEYKE